MKYAIISDIHGNDPALSAVIKDAESAGADQYIFVGDYVFNLPYPNEVVDKIRSMENKYNVRGNEEDRIGKLAEEDPATWNDGQFRAGYWCYRNLTDENRSFLTSLPQQIDFTDGGVTVHVAHASENFIGTVERRGFSPSDVAVRYAGKPVSHEIIVNDINRYLSEDPEFCKTLKTLPEGVYIFGHTHLQWHAEFQNRIFINPGSCGEPLDFLIEKIPYTLIEINDCHVKVEERQISFDRAPLIEHLRASSLYDQAAIWCEIVIRHLTTGCEHALFFLEYAEEYADRIGDKVRPYSVETWKNAYEGWIRQRGEGRTPK